MEKFYNAVCWAAIVFLALFFIPYFLVRYVAAPILAFGWLLSHSTLPWGERSLAAAAIIAGVAYLLSRRIPRRIPPNQNFAYYASKPEVKHSSTPKDL
jgi:hypothetical protein